MTGIMAMAAFAWDILTCDIFTYPAAVITGAFMLKVIYKMIGGYHYD